MQAEEEAAEKSKPTKAESKCKETSKLIIPILP